MNKQVELIKTKIESIYERVKNSELESDSGAFYYMKDLLDFIKPLLEESSKVWHDASEPLIIDKTFLLVSPNGNSSLCLWGGKKLLSVTLGGGHSVLCKGDKLAYIDDIINLQEEPSNYEYELSQMAIEALDRKRVCPILKGNTLHKFKNEWNTIKQILHWWETGNLILNYRLALHWVAWGAHNLKDLGTMSEEERLKLDIQEESVSEDLGEYINELSKQFQEVSFAKLSRIAIRVAKWQKQKDNIPASEDLNEAAHNVLEGILNKHEIINIGSCLDMFKSGAKWKEQQMTGKTIDGKVIARFPLASEPCYDDVEIYAKYTKGLEEGDKVKLIIIKDV